MKKLTTILALFISFQTVGQQLRLINLDELYQRVSAGNDTTYVINFWATWCKPCLEELPHFEKLSKQFSTQKMKVLFVSMDFTSKITSVVLPYVHKRKMTDEVFVLNEPDQQVYINRIDPDWSGAIPATLMINRVQRTFFEKAFTYELLLTAYKNIKKP